MFRIKKKYRVQFFIILCFLVGIFTSKIYQTNSKAEKIYIQALTDFNNENYANSYYQFSKVKYTSQLKQMAIYRQALCAKALGDKRTEMAKYKQLFTLYPYNRLSDKAKYLVAQDLVGVNPNLANRYFKQLEKKNIDKDYKIAINYYKGLIYLKRHRNKKLSKSGLNYVQDSFRKYLQYAPSGRLALHVANNWTNLSINISKEDKILIARTYTHLAQFNQSEELLVNIPNEDCWAIRVVNLYKLKKDKEALNLLNTMLSKDSKFVSGDDVVFALKTYLNSIEKKNIDELISKANGAHKADLLNVKCSLLKTDNSSCYLTLYNTDTNSKYAKNALFYSIKGAVTAKDYTNIDQLSKIYLDRYKDNTGYITYWRARAEQKSGHSSEAEADYRRIIDNYPDSYWAYRSFEVLNNYRSAIIVSDFINKPVEYPYRKPHKATILYNLMRVQDYDLMKEYAQDDFVKSWCEYQEGHYATSIMLAKNAMAKLNDKPGKNDLRWRLIYPQNYYQLIKSNAKLVQNNEALMMALIKEESHFNSNSQSGVGAIGLMQLMPATAHDVGNSIGIEFNTSDLFNPELNIKLGNLYFANLRKSTQNDLLAVGAYNGGVNSIKKWQSKFNYDDIDEFIAQIPYEETQEYIIKVVGSYWNYLRIYQ